jgi:hypothetical protein
MTRSWKRRTASRSRTVGVSRLRLAMGLATVFGLAACQDMPTQVTPEEVEISEHSDKCEGDFHFGDNCVSADGEEGSHVRLLHVNWVQVGPTEAEFTYVFGSRRSFYSGINVGTTRQFATVRFGDGRTLRPTFQVTFVDADGDWFEARATFRHTYAGAGPYTVFSTDCCRLSRSRGAWFHPNNPDGNTRIETLVNFVSAGSPATSIQPLVPCPRDAECRFNVAATAPGGQSIRWRLATAAEAGNPMNHPPGATIDANTGIYTWNTTGATLSTNPAQRTVYSTAVAMETLGDGGTVASKSVVDFLIEITDEATNASPVWVRPPTPEDGAEFAVQPGTTLMLDVRARDPDTDDEVTLGALGVPANATFTGGAGNPVVGTFTFTPIDAQLGQSYVVNFLATDTRGASAPSRSVIIRVVDTPPEIPVLIDIEQPESQAGTIDLSIKHLGMSQLAIVTVFGSAALDVRDIDIASLTLGHGTGAGAPPNRWGNGAIMYEWADANGDGARDLRVAFCLCDLGLPETTPIEVEMVLRGTLNGGAAFRGSLEMNIVGTPIP